jgi:hypothetical protein
MSSERYNQIIDETYKNFKNSFPMKKSNPPKDYINSKGQLLTKDQFIDKCKTDNEFSEKWGLKIEERELSLEEQIDLALEWGHDSFDLDMAMCNSEDGLTEYGIPAKLITVTYNNKTIEIYE